MDAFNKIINIQIETTLSRRLFIILPHLFILLMILIGFQLSKPKGLMLIVLIMMIFCVIASYVYFKRLHLTHSLKNSVLAIYKDSNNVWNLTLSNQRKETVSIASTSFMSNYLIVLNFKDASGKQDYTALLTRESLARDDYRRLKVLMKTSKEITN